MKVTFSKWKQNKIQQNSTIEHNRTNGWYPASKYVLRVREYLSMFIQQFNLFTCGTQSCVISIDKLFRDQNESRRIRKQQK
jgi:hypothetical protein